MVYKLIKKTMEKEKMDGNFNDHRHHFVHKYLGADGILLIYFMMDSNGFLKTEEVIGQLFKKYCAETQSTPVGTLQSWLVIRLSSYSLLLFSWTKKKKMNILVSNNAKYPWFEIRF